MILNISGRTDIIAFYSKWFVNRLKEGYVDVRNPFYPKSISRINLKNVDAYLFCTKNPIPLLDYINLIDKPIILHVTLTPYKNDIEPNVINKKEIIKAIKKLSNIIDKENLYIRYDPIFINNKYTIDYHIKAFNKLCNELNSYVNHIIISFIDEYKNVKKNYKDLNYKELTKDDYKKIGINFANIAKKNNITVQTCFEDNNLVEYGFIKKDCLSHELAYKLTGKAYKTWTARKGKKCNCVEMVDIGVYNSCKHFCKYCYANFDEKTVEKNFNNHNPNSSLLIGQINNNDIIKERYK